MSDLYVTCVSGSADPWISRSGSVDPGSALQEPQAHQDPLGYRNKEIPLSRHLPSLLKHRRSAFRSAVTLSFLLVAPFATASQAPFVHPGVLVDEQQLSIVREGIASGTAPWTEALKAVQESPDLASLDYRPRPREEVECGPFSIPNRGCWEETRDSRAAYTHALLWAYTGNERHRDKAIEIMDAWASTLRRGHTNSNAPLQASWAASLWPRAAEIIRHTSTAWPAPRVDAFAEMLQQQYLPDIKRMGPCHTFNWWASGIEARANIAVFLDDRAAFDEAIELWRERVRTSIKLDADGPVPLSPASCPREGAALVKAWFGQDPVPHGHAQETCRDLEHTAYGIAALVNVAETARIQGFDLYGEEAVRLQATMEYHAGLRNRASVPQHVCKGTLRGDLNGTLEIAFNHYAGRTGASLPETASWIAERRPARGYFHYTWETLTHGSPLVGEP